MAYGGLTVAKIGEMCGAGVEETQILFKYTDTAAPLSSTSVLSSFDKNSLRLSYSILERLVLITNQAISDVFMTLTDPTTGEVVINRVCRAAVAGTHIISFYSNTDALTGSKLWQNMADLAGRGYNIEIKARLGTGELVTAYSGLFTGAPCDTSATTHKWNDGVVTTPATYTECGVMTYTCVKCGATRTEELPKTVSAVRGDVDGDGIVNIKDISALKSYISGAVSEDEIRVANCDVDPDGIVNMKDISALKALIAG